MKRCLLIFFVFNIFVFSAFGQTEKTVARKTVLFEIATSVNCANCTAVSEAMDSLVHNNKNVSVIKYHYDDVFQSIDAAERVSFYKVTIRPTILIDGKERIVGGGYQTNLYPEYLAKYEKYIAQESSIDIDMDISKIKQGMYKISVSVTQLNSNYEGNLLLHLVLTESHIDYDWFNFDEANFVCRDMIKDHNGTRLEFGTEETLSFDMILDVDEDVFVENSKVIAFVQDYSSLEVFQAVKAPFPLQTSNDEIKNSNFHLYPNPVTDKLYFANANEVTSVSISNVLGKTVKSGSTDKKSLDISDLPKGIYIVSCFSGNKHIDSKRIVKK